MNKVFCIAEVGINANGDLNLAKKLIDVAVAAGCDAVKFQKRTIKEVYTPEELDVPRESPFGTTNREQKNGLEFSRKDYDSIDSYCRKKKIEWFASAWDIKSQNFLRKYDLKYNKVASAMLTVRPLLEEIASEGKYTFISTGMADLEDVILAVNIFKRWNCPYELMYCNSTYPAKDEDINLNIIKLLQDTFDCKVGYSGHEQGLQISLAAVAMGATSIERHITLDRTMYGSDQSASIEPGGLKMLIRDVRIIESTLGPFNKIVSEQEQKIKEKLAKPYWYKRK